MKRILVAHDGSKSSDKALKKAMEIAAKFTSAVTVVSVIPDLYLSELMDMDRTRIVTSLTEEAKKNMTSVKKRAAGMRRLKTVIRQGDPAEELLSAAKAARADLIVTGSHGRHGARRFLLGSVSSKIVDHAECAVLVVK